MKLILSICFVMMPVILFSWISSNEGLNYTMDDLCVLSDSISFNYSLMQYDVQCDIIVMENDTLTFEPGQTIEFHALHLVGHNIFYGLWIYGCLEAIGTDEEPITLGDPEFSFNDASYWSGIRFYDTSQNGESIMQYCHLIGAVEICAYFAIYCENSSPIIDHCIISHKWADILTGGGCGIYCTGQSYPFISYCTFEELYVSVAIWCGGKWDNSLGIINWGLNIWGFQDTLNYPSPLVYNCNIMQSVQGFNGFNSDYERVILLGGFLDNCYIGINDTQADTTLGYPIDTIGDGICTTTSTNWEQKFFMVDGVVNPRSTPEFTDINDDEINILPTTSEYLILNQNFPNPFNPSTTITFTITKENAENVKLVIYNVKGQKVKHLINKQFPTGQHSISWFGDDDDDKPVTSGVYFYKLSVGKEMKVKKAIVVK